MTISLRTAVDTARAVDKLGGRLPLFVHKWTKQKRYYSPDDLTLPRTLNVYGHEPSSDAPIVGVGGTRSPTVETFRLVSAVIRGMASRGAQVISGGVPGVDLAAHLAAADEASSATFVVVANPAHLGFYGHEWSSSSVENQVLLRGGFLSEYSERCGIETPQFRERLLARDRIISGLSDIFLVFECREDSATVDTARRAIAQGKRVACIDSTEMSVRRGIAQLASEFNLAVFDERKQTADEIVWGILDLMPSFMKSRV